MDRVQEQIQRLEATIGRQESEIRALEIQVDELHREIDPFVQEYDRVVQTVYDRVEAVRDAIDEFETIKQKIQTGNGVDAKKLWEAVSEASSLPPQSETEAPAESPNPKSKPRADESLKQLYRRLARRFHPDLAEDETDRDHRNHVMTLINEAYSNRDREALLTLDSGKGGDESAFEDDNKRVQVPLDVLKLRKLQQNSVDLANRIQDLKIEYHDLMYGQMMELKIQRKFAQAQGEDLLDDMANDLQQEYWELVKQLDNLRNGVN